MKATHMTVKPLNVDEFVITCMNNQKEERVAEKREERDRDLSRVKPEKVRIEGV